MRALVVVALVVAGCASPLATAYAVRQGAAASLADVKDAFVKADDAQQKAIVDEGPGRAEVEDQLTRYRARVQTPIKHALDDATAALAAADTAIETAKSAKDAGMVAALGTLWARVGLLVSAIKLTGLNIPLPSFTPAPAAPPSGK